MITRWMLIKLEHPDGVLEYTRAWLEALPGLDGHRLGQPVDTKSGASWDLALVLDFASEEALGRFLASETLRAYTHEYLFARGGFVKAWNFCFE